MTMSVEAAAQALREATQATVRRYSTWYLIQGVLMVIAGIVAFLYPFVSSAALVLFLGWILIISGIVQGISLIGAQNVPNFWLQLVSAVLSIIVGVLFLRRPGEAVVTLALLLIVFFMVEGFAKIVFSLTIRPLPNWGWVLGRVDGFDQDEAESKRDERAVILRRLLASKCDTLEAFELADRLFDACPCLVECFRKEGGHILGVGSIRDCRTYSALARGVAI